MDARARLDRPDWPERLALLGLEPVDRGPIERLVEHVLATPDELARVETMAERLLVRPLGQWDTVWQREGFPADVADHPVMAGGLALCALLASADDVHAYHRSRGVPDETSWRSLADMGQQVTKHRLVTGDTGLSEANWLRNVWNGCYLRLGRLQFEPHRSDLGGTLPEPVTVLNTHIPSDGGPMSPAAVDDSLRQAPEVFRRHYADVVGDDLRWLVCSSWLLDRQLLELVPGSNVADFTARWRPLKADVNDRDGYYFVFNIEPDKGRTLPDRLDELPRRTSLERALVGLWERGGHVEVTTGSIPVGRVRHD